MLVIFRQKCYDKVSNFYGNVMKKKVKLSLILKLLIPLGILVVLLILKFTAFSPKEFSLARYTIVGVEGFNTRAKATVSVDETGLYKALAGEKSTEAEWKKYETFVKSVTCSLDKVDNLSNGDELRITVSYDEGVAKSLGINVEVTEREYKVSGLRTGKELDLFADVKIITGGISPFIYVTCLNESEDEYLSGLEYSINKTYGLAIGDEITITCKIDKEHADSLGYYYGDTEKKYVISTADKYIDSPEEIDIELIESLTEDNINVIVSETANTTYHMVYKVTQDNSYLYRDGNEEAVGFALDRIVLANNNTGMEQEHENYIFVIYHGSIALPKYTQQADPYDYVDSYFCFKYSDAILSKDGEFLMATNDPHNRYVCADSYENVINSVLMDVGGGYDMQEYNSMEEE